jgi:hypothetical protein
MNLHSDWKVAIATSGAMGIGAATAQLLAQLVDDAEFIQSGECMNVPAPQIVKHLSGGSVL